MQRRFFLRQTTTGATAAAASSFIGMAASFGKEESVDNSHHRIDTHVSLGQWPFARATPDSPAALADHLRENGVVQAWTGSFDALLHHDLDGVNDRLVAVARLHSIFLPMGAVNPKLKTWKRTLGRCVKTHKMRGIRLHPDFHGYQLDDPDFLALLKAASAANLRVQISVGQDAKKWAVSSRISLESVDLEKLIQHTQFSNDLQILGVTGKTTPKKILAQLVAQGVRFDSQTGTEKWFTESKDVKLLFGSRSPMNRFPSLDEDALDSAQLAAIGSHNAENWMLQV